MLDITLIREHPERVQHALAKRGLQVDLASFLKLDQEYRQARTAVDDLRGERRQISAEVARLRRADGEIAALRTQAKAVGADLVQSEERLAALEAARGAFLDELPNLPDDDVVAGGKENNKVLRTAGHPPAFPFDPRDHIDLAQRLGLIDYERGVKLGGTGHWIYRGNGALLEWALLNFFVQAHLRDGYEFILPPHLLTYEAGYTAGQFPKFADEVFVVEPGESGPRRFLLPTSETALVNLHRDETLTDAELPRKYFAYSPCYRKEIGGYRASERGTLRGHQFDKVEMFQFVRPDASEAAHQELLRKAEQLVADLGLHYRVTQLAAGDTTSAMAKAFDIEV
ncbi:aminoacyl--tRNA ligase-related protein [Streptacidiphilus sp. EB103A]|uniref:aminoacyl--tRNA ligase-related protein n=1 Tax=Streptacidiphilus sp. EB103A TaxID=3156275 RepID=UPI003513E060